MPRVHYRRFPWITSRSRGLRKNLTPSERIVWELLRKRKAGGFKFLRQHPVICSIDGDWVEYYIPDFYCAELKLIIEVDGEIHRFRKDYDRERDRKLVNKGLTVIRIHNDDTSDMKVLNDIISKIIQDRASG
jgi:very-short-patch-repair endonuclease